MNENASASESSKEKPLKATPEVITPSNYIEMARLAQGSFDERRRYEWQVNLSLWAALGLLVYACIKENISVFDSTCGAYLFGGIVLIFYLVFHFMVSRGHAIDKSWKHYYLGRAEGAASEKAPKHRLEERWTYKIVWWIPPVGFTVALLYLVIRVLLQQSGTDA